MTKTIFFGTLLLVAGGTLYLWTVDIPAPGKNVTKTISNDRFKQ